MFPVPRKRNIFLPNGEGVLLLREAARRAAVAMTISALASTEKDFSFDRKRGSGMEAVLNWIGPPKNVVITIVVLAIAGFVFFDFRGDLHRVERKIDAFYDYALENTKYTDGRFPSDRE